MQPYANPFPVPPLDLQRNALKQDGRFIGTGMLLLIALSQFLYTAVVLFLTFLGAIPASAVTSGDPDLGMGNTRYLLLYMGVYIVMMGLPLAVSSLIYHRGIQPFAPARRLSPLTFIGGLLGGMSLCVVANIVASYLMSFFKAMGIPEPQMPRLLEPSAVSFWLNMLVFAALPAILEEMAFRGYVLQALRPYGDRTAVLVSSLLFALMHGNILQVPFAFIVGLVLGYAVVQTNNIWLAVCIHFANNAMSNILQYIEMPMKTAAEQNRMTTMVFAALGIAGMLALMLLKVKRSPLGAPVARNRGGVSTGSQLAALCASPAFLVSLILFIVLIVFNVAVSMLPAEAIGP